ncbi:hypothetical protein [Streptomyces phaeofaciens]|uniref:hypothetical protein n=1 Tax=Streptomyces phaeofaciens TaxID=68254 RepID=UPI00367AE2D0
MVAGEATAYGDRPDAPWPYRPLDTPAGPPAAERLGIVLVPYHSWANRGPSTMRVWLPAERSAGQPPRPGAEGEV